MSGVLVIAEHRQGALREATLECLGAALSLAPSLGGQVTAALLADDPQSLAGELQGRAHGLKLYAHPELAAYNPELYLPVLADIIAASQPSLILMPHSSQGMDLAPALAGRLGLPLVTDCAGLSWSDGALSVQRNVYGGKAVLDLALKPAATVVATLQAGAFQAPPAGAAPTASDRTALTELAPRHARRFLEYLAGVVEDVDIAEADILVSVGRGIGGPDNVPQAQALAEALGATLSCSRPVADAGWLPKSRQVGTSGKTVRPKIYLALGISGAFQHQAGMNNSGTIIAVNSDPRAPIFQVAHYGIVADMFEVLPKLTELFKG
ncbi:MAG: electron transfer flavoprotein subunit alpha/FixB family protein [Proteobacteria bacterium]|nr:electron transfer flavoprotein subunit alpha/FixB family protein [Pseudomonadota bacterium]MBU1451435.1 electron transfer flavoprotein subunit alpha/FixB family protein [Pseudomonadota bacterium]MBU2467648.1 electron transfer flavoprotein subunit alpha/FixB family protein [Pseudomonadota bacterium]MBU2517482.1 electron transfer flavoprotein subunit alpha/FixB family protein [Pseudomonadota bacterium]